MITGDILTLTDALTLLVIGWSAAILLLPIAQWIEYKRDCKKHGKDYADELRRRWR